MSTGEKAVSTSGRMLQRYAPFLAIIAIQFVLLWMTPGSKTATTVQAPVGESTGEVSGGATLEQQPGAVAGSNGAAATPSGSAGAATGGAVSSGAGTGTTRTGATTAGATKSGGTATGA